MTVFEQISEGLDRGRFCYLATRSAGAPHLTPVVFVFHRKRVWVTTARSSFKARAWRHEPYVGALVPWSGGAVGFLGRVQPYDGLDPTTWGSMVRAGPSLGLAAAAFTRRNARFFAGYAVDAHRVPLAWTPPGRVFAAVSVQEAFGFDAQGMRHTEHPTSDGGASSEGMILPLTSAETFRRVRNAAGPLASLPPDVAQQIGTGGRAVLSIDGTHDRARAERRPALVGRSVAPLVFPARWLEHYGVVYAAVDLAALRMAGGGPVLAVAVTADHASSWRARAMTGIMFRGPGTIVIPAQLRTGRTSAEDLLRMMDADAARSVLVRMAPERLVWWRGWASGTVRPA